MQAGHVPPSAASWGMLQEREEHTRGHLVELMNSRRVELADLTLKDRRGHVTPPCMHACMHARTHGCMHAGHVPSAHLALNGSPFWTTHFYGCDDVHVHGVTITADEDAPNTDGFNPDSSSNVRRRCTSLRR